MSNIAARLREPPSNWPVLPGTLKRGDVEGLLVDLRSALGLSPARLDVLLAMIRRTRPSDWTDTGADAVCYVQQQQLAMDLGKSARALRYDEAALVRIGLICRETIGNGRRCAPAVSSPEKYGLSFSPLIRQVSHLLELRELVQREAATLRALRLSCLALRQQFRLVLSQIREAAPDSPEVLTLELTRTRWPSRMDGRWTAEALEAHRAEVAESLQEANEFLAQCMNLSGEPATDFRSQLQDTTERPPESCSCPEGEHAERLRKRNLTSFRTAEASFLKPSQIYAIASDEMRFWLDCLRKDRREFDQTDFIEAAARRVPELGINDSAWEEAVNQMGPMRAALSILIVDANREHPATPVRSPGGLLRTFTRFHRAGRLNLNGSLIGLIERKHGSRAGADSDNQPFTRRSSKP